MKQEKYEKEKQRENEVILEKFLKSIELAAHEDEERKKNIEYNENKKKWVEQETKEFYNEAEETQFYEELNKNCDEGYQYQREERRENGLSCSLDIDSPTEQIVNIDYSNALPPPKLKRKIVKPNKN